MEKVTIIDSLMGSGKTSWAIEYMGEALIDEKFIYITPFLDEVTRVKDNVEGRSFVEPNPENEEGSKLESLKVLLSDNYNICATHALFKGADDEIFELLSESNYTLILDESFGAVEPVKGMEKLDVSRLLRSEDILIDAITKRVDWIGDPNNGAKYDEVRVLAQSGSLYCYRGSMFVWTFPPEIFKAFETVIIMTYMFKGQPQRFYFDMFDIGYQMKAVSNKDGGKYRLVEYDVMNEPRKEMYELINVYEGNRNDFDNVNSKRVTWGSVNSVRASRSDEFVTETNKRLRSFFLTDCKAKREDVMYAAKKELLERLSPTGYREPNVTKKEHEEFYALEENRYKKIPPKVRLPVNARATNMYSHKRALAYMFNCYMNLSIKSFFQDNGSVINAEIEGAYGVGELLQWVYRSRIRNGEDIQLYLPSSRMRGLLEDWAKYKI